MSVFDESKEDGEYIEAHSMDTMDSSMELDENVDTKPDWLEDDTVPPGYKRRIFDNNAMVHSWIPAVLTPDGLSFRSRQGALRVLIKKKAPHQDIEQLRSCLVYEGWQYHELLPSEEWRFRKHTRNEHKTKIEFLSEKAEFFKSLKEATQYIEDHFGVEVLKRTLSLIEILNVETRIEIYDWSEDDSIPPGWKIRIAEGKTNKQFFLSPDGKMFPTRTVAVQHMIRENFTEDEVDLMKLKLVEHEGWQFHGKLPFGWLLKETDHIWFLTREGDVLESFTQVFEFIKLHDGYSDLDNDLLQQLTNEIAINRRLGGYEWEESKTLPPGWKFRCHKGKKDLNFVLAPTGEQFTNRRVAFMFMFENNYPEDDIEKMRQSLQEEGWKNDRMMPNKKWIYSRNNREIKFLSDDGKYLRGFKQALEIVESRYEKSVVQKFRSFLDLETIRKRTLGYNWNTNDSSVPEGWMTRQVAGKTNKTFLLSPDGIQFHTRRQALQSMIKNGADEDDIDTMRSLLHHEGFERNPLLPRNWFYRDASQSSYQILTDLGDLHESFVSALEFMRQNGFTSSQIKKMEAMEKQKSKMRNANLSEWEQDCNLPSGWKSRPGLGNGNMLFLSPEGVTHHSRRSCLQVILKSKCYSAEDIQKVMNYAKLEHWEQHPCLPRGWMIRTIRSGDFVLTSDGELFDAQKQVKDYMKTNSRYSDKDLENLDKAFEDVNKRIRLAEAVNEADKDQTILNSSNLPGWKLHYKGERLLWLVSPTDVKCNSKLEALVFMSKEGYPIDNVKLLLASMKTDGWKFSKVLPEFWMYRSKKIRGDNVLGVNLEFLSPQGRIFKNIQEAVKHIATTAAMKDFDTASMVKYFSNMQEKVKSNKEDWEEDDRLPAGFRLRVHSGRVDKTFYLSRDGTQFGSLKLLLVHMYQEKYEAAEIKKIKELMHDEGFKENEYLPDGWLIRYTFTDKSMKDSNSFSHLVIITDKGQTFGSFSSVLEMMDNSEAFTETHKENIRTMISKQSMARRQGMESWMEDDTLPAGWRLKKPTGKMITTLYLSPEGDQFHSRKAALVHMIINNYPEKVVEAMRSSMNLEGFVESDLLPTKWLIRYQHKKYRNGGGVNVCIISDKGEIFESFSTAIQMMENSSGFTEEDIAKVRSFMDEKCANRRQSMNDWQEDNTLPSGWKLRKHNGKVDKTYFLSPGGDQFPSRRLALVHMIQNNHDSGAVDTMRSSMGLEGYEESDLLPAKWLIRYRHKEYKTQGGGVNVSVISDAGIVYESFSSVINFMEYSSEFTEEDVAKIRKYMDDKLANRRQTKDDWQEDDTLPSGWKLKKHNGKTEKTFYLSPEGEQFKSRRLALIHVITNHYSERVVQVMRDNMGVEGYEQSELLPANWVIRYRHSEDAGLDVHIITDTGDTFLSFSSVMEMMRKSSEYTQQHIDNINKYSEIKRNDRRKSSELWSTDPDLPKGWKFRTLKRANGEVLYFLSPSGETILSRKLLYAHFLQKKDSKAAKKVKNLLMSKEGWKESQYLPSWWLYRDRVTGRDKTTDRKIHGYKFLTREGSFHEGSNSALDHMKTSPGYTDQDVAAFSKLIPSIVRQRGEAKVAEVADRPWLQDASVPSGWRTRAGREDGGKSFQSPDGLTFQTRRTALVHLLASAAAEADVARMRAGLLGEGWALSKLLPPDWCYKLNEDKKQQISIIAPDGSLLRTVKAAEDYIKEAHPNYTNKFKLFEKNVTKSFRKSK